MPLRVPHCCGSGWLARHCASAELRLMPDDGHISVLNAASNALGGLRAYPEWIRGAGR